MVKKKTSKRKPKFEADGAHFELAGNIYLVETAKGKELQRTEIDGTTVLQLLINILEDSVTKEEMRRNLKDEYANSKNR